MNNTTTETETVNLLEQDYELPEREYEPTALEVKAEQVHKRDLYHSHEVGEVKVGTKWVYIHNTDGKKLGEFPLSTVLQVERRVETKESEQEQQRAFINRKLANKLAERDALFQSVLQKFNEETAKQQHVDYSSLGNLLEAQAELKVWNEFAGWAMSAKPGQDLMDVRDRYLVRVQDHLLSEHHHRAVSKSTSVTANLLEDCDMAALASFVSDAKWDRIY